MKRRTQKKVAKLLVFALMLLILAAVIFVGCLLVRWIGGVGPQESVTTTAAGTTTSVATTTTTTTTTTAASTTTTVTTTAASKTTTTTKQTTATTSIPVTVNKTGEWNLILVNPWNRMPEDYSVTLKALSGGHKIDERAYPDLQEMMDACRAAGLSPVICSSYRTQAKQESLYKNKINRLLKQGYSQEDAVTEAGRWVAVPGTSEHQLGLALDIVDSSYRSLDEKQEETATQKWLMAHSYEYGFVLRYPTDKGAITGIGYEPWHYRYVGKKAAKAMYDSGLCLEEYVKTLA